jgi:hypothetical protein
MSEEHRIASSPEWDAVHAFDTENNVLPFRSIAERIAWRFGYKEPTHPMVDAISSALEDAYNLGERRGPLIEAARSNS